MQTYAIIVIIYIIAMLAIGAYTYAKNKSLSDFFLGGRNLGPWQSALSAQASDMSGWLLLGLPGVAYALYVGTTEAIWTAIGLAVGTYLNWLIVAKRLRKFTQVFGDSITIPVYFENRFRDKTKLLRTMSAIFIMIFFLIYTAAQFAAGAKVFGAVFHLEYNTGLLIGAFVIVGYTFLGGFTAVCLSDVIQGMMMFLALLVIPIAIVFSMGGLDQTTAVYSQITTEVFTWLPRTSTGGISFLLLISAFGWGLGYFGQPHILVRFMAVRNSKEIKPARIIAMIWVITTLAAAVLVGFLGRVYVFSGKLPADLMQMVVADNEKLFIALAMSMFGPIIGGLLLSSILAAIMSTADSQLLVTASSITEDLYLAFSKKRISDKALVLISRSTVIAVSLVALFFAIDPDSSVFRLVSLAWGGFGAAFGPCILFSLYWKRMTVQGAIAGVLSGGVTDIVWYNLKGGIFDIYELVPAFIISCAVIVSVSLFTDVPIDIQNDFDKARTEDI